MNFDKALELAISYLRADIPTALWGAMGIGKSALGQLLADRFKLEFIDIRLGQIEPVDLNGFAHKDEKSKTFDYYPWARFPLEDTPLPEGKNGWLIMFDEGNIAPRQNLAAAYKIFLDRMVGMRKLHPNCRIMMGGNLVGQGLAGAIPAPLVSRMAHIFMTPDLVPAHRQILGQGIYSFLTNHPKFTLIEPDEPNTPFPTLRTWEMVHKYTLRNPNITPDAALEGMTGIVGKNAAVAYASFYLKEKELLEHLKGVEVFPLEAAQDLLEYLSADITQLDKHLHRFPGEWATIAKVKSESIKSGTDVS